MYAIRSYYAETIPTWVYLLIVAIVIAVIVIFSLYLYRVGLGRMVECGNCGALIPEASKHCPKCGVEFESDTAVITSYSIHYTKLYDWDPIAY